MPTLQKEFGLYLKLNVIVFGRRLGELALRWLWGQVISLREICTWLAKRIRNAWVFAVWLIVWLVGYIVSVNTTNLDCKTKRDKGTLSKVITTTWSCLYMCANIRSSFHNNRKFWLWPGLIFGIWWKKRCYTLLRVTLVHIHHYKVYIL